MGKIDGNGVMKRYGLRQPYRQQLFELMRERADGSQYVVPEPITEEEIREALQQGAPVMPEKFLH